MTTKKKSLQDRVVEILDQAEQTGAKSNFFFVTTFKRYQVQMKTLTDLERAISEYGPTITKEYVKGRQNICINPAIGEYAKISQAANNTVQTLIKIVEAFKDDTGAGDALAAFLNNDE